MNIEFANDKAVPNKKSHTATSPKAAGSAPQGEVAAGRARNPPPMVVPAIRAACDSIVECAVLSDLSLVPSADGVADDVLVMVGVGGDGDGNT